MKKTERLAAIVLRLQSRSLVRASELAEEFEVGVRTIYRDMEALAEAGVPLRAEAGVGYALERGWKLPPISLDAGEAAALLVACRIAEAAEGPVAAQATRSAMAKVRSVLPAPQRAYVESLDLGIEAFPGLEAQSPQEEDILGALRDAMARGRLLRISYRSASGEESEREVEPLGLYREPRGWRLIAWCALRGGYRQFLASRIASAAVLDEAFDRSLRPSAAELLELLGAESRHFIARLRCERSAASGLKAWAYAVRSETSWGDEAELELVLGDAAWYARATLSAASSLRAVAPPELAEEYERQAALALEAASALRAARKDESS
jgi:Predicted transcriptional regulator